MTKLTILLATSLAACAAEPATENELPRAFAQLLADDEARTAIQTHLAETGADQLSLTTLRDLALAEGTVADRLAAPIDSELVVAPNGLSVELLEHPPLVAYVGDTTASTFTFFDANGPVATLPSGESPDAAFVVIRPHDIVTDKLIVGDPEPASATLNLYIRGIRLNEDNDAGSDEEIYIRCKQGSGSWKKEDLTSVNGTNYYNLWDQHVMSLSSTGQDLLCEIWEEDGGLSGGDDFVRSASVSVPHLDVTSHENCIFLSNANRADLWFSKSKGINQCPGFEYLGIYCAQECS